MGRNAKPIEVSRMVDEVALIAVPRRLLEKAPPAFVTQRNCLETMGLSKYDFLRLAGSAFPIRKEKQLRIARYEDVVAALQPGAHLEPKYERPKQLAKKSAVAPPVEVGKLTALDYRALNRKAGLTKA